MHGMILKPADLDYSDLEKFGRVTIEYTSRGVEITVDGFEFSETGTCRQHGAKAMAWARDVLACEIEANRLIPGGHMVSCSGLDQEMLENESTGK
ncbi:phage capsid protein [Trinickia sp.]|uniref:phage capsid protein n=1 Tax=Trinickia sp. TaxID=2571163 RepID=UPI003F815F7B